MKPSKSSRFFEKKRRKKLLLPKSEAVSTPLAPGQKSFAELFFRKATAYFHVTYTRYPILSTV
jgi:hypothetical protein